MTTLNLRWIGAFVFLCFALVAASAQPAAAQTDSVKLVVFGDSLSDPGNGFTFLKASATPPDYSTNALLVPSSPYARGGHRLTNGPTWAEQLALSLGAVRNAEPAFQSSNPYAMNFAIATARAREGVLPNLSFEVSAFLAKVGGTAPSGALYVIEVGSNDIRDALEIALQGGDPSALLHDAAVAIANNISILYAAGARNFIVWDAPDAGLTPAAGMLDAQFPGAADLATDLTNLFNFYLAVELQPFILQGIVVPFQASVFLKTIYDNHEQFGLTNVTEACISPNDPPFACQNPDEYLFWDGVHLTAAVHAIIAQQIAALLEA